MDTEQSIRILMLLENESFPEDSRVWLQSQSLVSAGYSVTVICPTSNKFVSKRECIGGVEVYRYPRPLELSGFLGYSLEFAYALVAQFLISLLVWMKSGFDAIHMHTPPDFNAVIPAFYRWFGKKFIYDLHDLSPELFQAQRNGHGSSTVYQVLLWFERFACQQADLLLATNETQRARQICRGGADANKCVVVRNGPSEAFLRDVKPVDRFNEPNRLKLGYVGVMGVQDGVDYLVRAADCLIKQHRRSDFQVVVVGSGPAMENLQRLVKDLDLQPFFAFTGFIPLEDVPAYIAAFDICCTPDPSNTYNDSCTTIKTMEYMALSKPVVCFQTTENIKTAGAAALYAADNDVGMFAAEILKLMDDPELRHQLGREGRNRIEAGLLWRHQAEVMIAAYDQLFHLPVRNTVSEGVARDSSERETGQQQSAGSTNSRRAAS